jgi:hypothetical protein
VYPALHWQLVAAGLSIGDCAWAGHASQFALPTVFLNVSAAHPTHASPSGPEKPTLHLHAVSAALAGGACAWAGHAEQFALPSASLKVSGAHCAHGPPSLPK